MLLLLMSSASTAAQTLPAWTLTVGQTDLTSYVLSGASFTEIASSSDGSGLFTVNGIHDDITVGASVTLQINGITAWEGSVTSAIPQGTIATMVMAAPLSAKLNIGISGGSYQNNDVAVLAARVASATSLPWGGPATLGVAVGALSFTQGDEALTVLSSLANRTWRVQNGNIVFVSVEDGLHSVQSLQGVANTISTIDLLGGSDASTRIPLATQAIPVGAPSGPTCYVSQPEIADAGTLQMFAQVLADRYGAGAISGSLDLPNTVLRAGDWLVDASGVTAIAYQTRYELTSGLMQLSVQFGFPSIPKNPQYSASFADAMHRFPVTRVSSNYVVQGCTGTIGSGGVDMTSGLVVIDDVLQPAISEGLAVPDEGVSYIVALPGDTAYQLSPTTVLDGVNLYRVTMQDGEVIGLLDIRPQGGAGSNNVKPNALYPAHFSGDTSGDRSVNIFNAATMTMNHGVMSEPTQARILSDNTLKVDGTTGPVSGDLPYSNHDAAFRARVLSDKTLLVDGTTGPVSGNLPYANHNSDLQGTFLTTGTGRVKASDSTLLNANVPNSTAFFQDFTWEWSYTYTSGSPSYYTYKIWFDNGTAGNDAKIYLPNYQTTPGDRDINLGHTTSSSPAISGFIVDSGQSLYLMAYYTPGLGIQVSAQVSPFTPSQLRIATQDGGYITAFATVGTGAIQTPTGTVGGSGSAGGNGGRLPNTY